MRARWLAFLLLVLIAAPVAAQVSNLPTLTAPVNDAAGVIDAESARALDAKIRALKDATGDVVIVTTVPSIKPYATVEEYAAACKQFDPAPIIVPPFGQP